MQHKAALEGAPARSILLADEGQAGARCQHGHPCRSERVEPIRPAATLIRMRAAFREKYLDLLGSIYIYNEHRGYTAIDDLLAAVRDRWPHDHVLIAQIEKH